MRFGDVQNPVSGRNSCLSSYADSIFPTERGNDSLELHDTHPIRYWYSVCVRYTRQLPLAQFWMSDAFYRGSITFWGKDRIAAKKRIVSKRICSNVFRHDTRILSDSCRYRDPDIYIPITNTHQMVCFLFFRETSDTAKRFFWVTLP